MSNITLSPSGRHQPADDVGETQAAVMGGLEADPCQDCLPGTFFNRSTTLACLLALSRTRSGLLKDVVSGVACVFF